MTDVDGDEGFLADPETIIAAAVTVVEPHLSNATIHAAINQAASTRTQRRRLAIALTSAPELLTSGHPQGPPQIESLISALRATGAQRVTPPRCAHCGRALHLPHRDGDLRICTGCDRRRRSEPCVDCGATTSVATRDEDGRPRCTHCRPRKQPDSAEQIVTYITSLDPGLNRAALRQLICDAVPQAFQRRRVARELEQDPALLTGQAAKGSPRLNALVRGLLAAGARNVVAPACPSCGRTVALRYRIGGVRCCRRCYDQTRLEACSRCGRHTPVASRTITGKPVCVTCFNADTANHGRCDSCGRSRSVFHREGDGRALCHRCWRAPTVRCSICGLAKPCHFADTDAPRCENCSRQLKPQPCSRCGKQQPVWSRTTDGQPLCARCTRRRECCTGCRRVRSVTARLAAGPYCATCYRKHPDSFRACTRCGAVERLHHYGLCVRCACRDQLLALLGDEHGGLSAHAGNIYQVFDGSDPGAVLTWLRTTTAQTILGEIAHTAEPLTHADLDRYPPGNIVEQLRGILTAGGVLPPRDEHLARLQYWLTHAVEDVADPAERRIVYSFATWHQLRRLRRQSERRQITDGQAERARNTIRAAINLTGWLDAHGTRLADCTQADIDQWLAYGPASRRAARTFITWADQHGHTRDVQIPLPPPSVRITRITDDQRWATVKRLLHDDRLAAADRVAGLLVLLYGQSLTHITLLTRDKIIANPKGDPVTSR
jgi:hypothetical protein